VRHHRHLELQGLDPKRRGLRLLPKARHVGTILTVPAVVLASVTIVEANRAKGPHLPIAGSRIADTQANSATQHNLRPQARQPAAATGLDPSATDSPPPTTAATATTNIPRTVPAPNLNSSAIGIGGGQLMLDGRPYRFMGVDAYEIATYFGTNAGCGAMETDAQLEVLFSSLPSNSLVRIWAFQGSMATNVKTRALDWGPLDRVFAAATAHHQRLIVVLTDQGGTCDGNFWQGPSWFSGGFTQVFNDPMTTDGHGLTPLSYWEYFHNVVNRYRNSPALGMWEPVSEPEASTCTTNQEPQNCWGHNACLDEAVAAQALRHFFDVVGGEIHALDPSHLVESGTIGGGQCGTAGIDFRYVSASPGIDVLSYHDYYPGSPMGGDQWNGLGVRFAQASALAKPIIGGEVGENAGNGSACRGLDQRTSDLSTKAETQMRAGSSGLLVWDWLPAPSATCTTDTFPGDPLMQIVHAGVSS
jgi:mannan endo-1,4-beta-mannosidase